jgi:mRNA-degrading endonuclease toxin of MazEF toxin-antitoxin module
MHIKRGHLYIVDFNPRVRTKPGKLRPALVVQSNLVNEAGYPSTIVIPTTSKLMKTPAFCGTDSSREQEHSTVTAICCSGN